MSLPTRLLHRMEAIALRLAVGLFRLIPVDLAASIMGFLWRTIAPFTHRHKRALAHLETAYPELTGTERETIARGMWDNLGRVAAETFFIDRLLKDGKRFEPVADEATRRVLNGETGAIFVSLHTGNWELCVQPAAANGVEIAGVYQALKNPIADEMLRDMRHSLYAGGLHSKGHQTARKLISILRKGGVVAIMGDLRETRGLKVPFFGRPAFANPVPVSLARSCGVPIILGRTVRKSGSTFKIEGRGYQVPVTHDRQADIEKGTADIHAIFEDWIREHPEQWMWIHRKWAKANG
ncbi:lipid A biosynthesis lauroyl acyltransferase [Roseibium aquae]|uniref:Lipid A biosynthesis lauroyl acyltransferase n=1 Tax=Roseibium aquae TaxID=1323746 RepID=A0A916WZP2_9HYPH|nr:lipid A biosynthesis acyltransferase [Roseibium aquae]GGB45202.1 lipid A biosynthesis lauroyl acyltransferase [Roseibium aquae]